MPERSQGFVDLVVDASAGDVREEHDPQPLV
jgi:hypothetical protein